MMEFSVNTRESKDTPCGYPKSFRLVALNHTVKDVFHTNDVYDKFIAIGKGISYSDDFISGYWHNAVYNAAVNTEFVSGCHLSSVDVELNIIMCDNGEYQYSYDGETWYYGGRICSALYDSGWSCVCASSECVVAVNGKYQKAGSDESMSGGIGACGTWNAEKKVMEWKEISLPFPSSSIKYFNGYFYIYGQVEKTSGTITFSKSDVTEGEPTSLNKVYYCTVEAGQTEISFSENGGFDESGPFQVYLEKDGRESKVESSSQINGERVTITLSIAPEETSEYSVRYSVPALAYTITFVSEIEEEIHDIDVYAKTEDGHNVEIKNCVLSATGNENEYSIIAVCEDYSAIESFNILYYSISSNIADVEQSAISDNGINFCTNEDSFSSDAGAFICDAAYGRGIYMAVTTEGNAIYSTQTPSRNWDYVKSLSEKGCYWSGITFVCGMFVVCGTTNSGSYVMYCSYNTKDWIKVAFNATSSIDIADVTAYPIRLINCRGTLVATAVSPQTSENGDIILGDEKGFYACDTYISIEEEPAAEQDMEENSPIYTQLIKRLTAAENHIRELENELANRPIYNQYKGDISSQEQFDLITNGVNTIGDTYNLACPVAYVADSVLYQSDFSNFLFTDDGLEIRGDYSIVRDNYDGYLWTLTWDPASLINSAKVRSILSSASSCACTVYNNANAVIAGVIESASIDEGNLKIRARSNTSLSLPSSITWTSVLIDNQIETNLSAGTNIIWNGAGWDDTSKNDSMSNYITVSQSMKMLAYGTSDLYDKINDIGTDSSLNEKINNQAKTANNSFANAVKGEASGTVVRVDDVSPVEHEVDVRVRSKNLANIPAVTKESNNAWVSIKIATLSLPSGVYTFSADYVQEGDLTVAGAGARGYNNIAIAYGDCRCSEVSGRMTMTFTIPDGINTFDLHVYSNASSNVLHSKCTFSNIQLEKGSVATEYTPYVDPSTVKVIRSEKNLFNIDKLNLNGYGLLSTKNADGTYTLSGTLTQTYNYTNDANLFIPAGTTVTISSYFECEKAVYVGLVLRVADNSIIFHGNSMTNGSSNTITLTEDVVSVSCVWRVEPGEVAVGDALTIQNIKLQLEVNATKTEYEPYSEQNYLPNADGTVEGVTSLAPTMTLLPDKAGVTLELGYNRDVNKVIEELINAIISLGGNV